MLEKIRFVPKDGSDSALTHSAIAHTFQSALYLGLRRARALPRCCPHTSALLPWLLADRSGLAFSCTGRPTVWFCSNEGSKQRFHFTHSAPLILSRSRSVETCSWGFVEPSNLLWGISLPGEGLSALLRVLHSIGERASPDREITLPVL